jgi:hypothetical protein
MACRTVNPEAILASPRFRHCAWVPECGPLIRYLKAWAANPRIETLVKCGLGQMALKRGLTERIRRNGQFRRFFFERADEIRDGGYTVETIYRAFRDRTGLAEADERVGAERQFRTRGEKPADAVRALKYLAGQRGATVGDYCCYLRDCRRLGMDMADTKTIYPRDFHARQAEADARCRALDRRENRAARSRNNALIAAQAEIWRAIEEIACDRLTARLPRGEADLLREGKALMHCVGTVGRYAEEHAAGKSLIVFLRRAEAPD